jgi:hypothetical protein
LSRDDQPQYEFRQRAQSCVTLDMERVCIFILSTIASSRRGPNAGQIIDNIHPAGATAADEALATPLSGLLTFLLRAPSASGFPARSASWETFGRSKRREER